MPPSETVVAVVLAGGDRDDRLAVTVGAVSKALVPLRDVPMGAYVAHALRASGVVGPIVWVGPTDARIRRLVDVELPSGRRMVDSLSLGLGAALALAPRDARMLVVTADVPWWDPDGVRRFVTGSPAGDLVYPVVSEEVARRALPRPAPHLRAPARRPLHRRQRRAADPRRHRVAPAVLDAAFHARKRPWDLARLVGIGTLIGPADGHRAIAAIEARVSELLGVRARAYVSPTRRSRPTSTTRPTCPPPSTSRRSRRGPTPDAPGSMRRPEQLRRQAALSASAALAVALLAAYAVFLALGREGRLGFGGFNAAGLLEGLAFVVALMVALSWVRAALRLPSPVLLSFGLVAPPRARKVAARVPVVDAAGVPAHPRRPPRRDRPGGRRADRHERRPARAHHVVGRGRQGAGRRGRHRPASLLAHEQLVVVMDGDEAVGVVTQEAYLAGLWGASAERASGPVDDVGSGSPRVTSRGRPLVPASGR
jgi:molybdopterin-guanine dinucleotide biosynthesis protein A